MTKKPTEHKPAPTHSFAQAVEQVRQTAAATQRIRDAFSDAQKTSEILQQAIGLNDLKKHSQLLDAQVDMREAIRRAFEDSALPNLNPSITSTGIKATDLAKAATFNRALGQDKIAAAFPARIPHRLTQYLDAESGALSDKASPANLHDAIATAKDIGRLVRKARETRKLSQQSFADLTGVGRRFISELENGKATLEFDKVVSVAAAAGIDLMARER